MQELKLNVNNRAKIRQVLKFGTLEKFTHVTFDKYLKRIAKENIKNFVLMPKYDGIGMRIYYDAKGTYTCLTRYDQEYGLDITFKCKNIKLPKLTSAAVRGELITLVEHEGYASKRNYVSS